MSGRVLVSVLLVGLLLAAAGGLATWMVLTRPRPPQEAVERIVPRVAAPPVRARRDYRVSIVGYGSARPRVRTRIAPLVGGQVVGRAENFLSGRFVREGQVLIEIDRTDFLQARDAARGQVRLLNVQLDQLTTERENLQASLAIEQDRLDLAEEQLAKVRRLRRTQAATENDVDVAKESVLLRKSQLRTVENQLALIPRRRENLRAQTEVAEVELARAETALGRTRVVSPVTGRVLSHQVEVGERVAPGQVCGEVYGTDVMDIPVPIPASDLQWLPERTPSAGADPNAAAGARAKVVWYRPDDPNATVWTGRIARVEAGLARDTRMATVVVEVRNGPPSSAGPLLDLNMFCKVTIAGRVLAEAFLLPRRALLPDGRVYVVEDGRLGLRSVRVARVGGEQAMLLPGGGVEAGDRVIIGYVPKPVPGMKVVPVDEPRRTAATTRPADTPRGG